VDGAGRPGFMSARAQMVTDLRKKGQHQQANRLNQVRVTRLFSSEAACTLCV
jgi:hypothetical protein